MTERYLSPRSAAEFCAFSLVLVERASERAERTGFLEGMAEALMDFASCDAVEMWPPERASSLLWEACREEAGVVLRARPRQDSLAEDSPDWAVAIAARCQDTASRQARPAAPIVHHRHPGDPVAPGPPGRLHSLPDGRPVRSLLALPVTLDEKHTAVVVLKSAASDRFRVSEVELYPLVGQALESAWRAHATRASLTERVKELTCLLGLSKLAAQPGLGLDEALQRVAALLPPAWQYPEVCAARICFDGECYESPEFRAGDQRQRAHIVADGDTRGFVEVLYAEERPPADEGPFLVDERNLIDAVARQLGLLVERRRAADEEEKLRDQLRHADRLATIGQLAAGVAHELNEPLGSVLGFAELAAQSEGLPAAAQADLERIRSAALHARNIVRKLRLFARQSLPERARIDLNELITEGLYLVESRCAKQSVVLDLDLDPARPCIHADRGQVHQVLVNLTVNAVQAMPEGGRLTVASRTSPDGASLIVSDTGCGVPAKHLNDIFLPFFTTKDVDEGTGLGLSVVLGIMSAHGGRVSVASEEGQGSRFEAFFPLP